MAGELLVKSAVQTLIAPVFIRVSMAARCLLDPALMRARQTPPLPVRLLIEPDDVKIGLHISRFQGFKCRILVDWQVLVKPLDNHAAARKENTGRMADRLFDAGADCFQQVEIESPHHTLSNRACPICAVTCRNLPLRRSAGYLR